MPKQTWSQRRKERLGKARESTRRPGHELEIPALYAFLAIRDDDEGIVGSVVPGIGVMPLVASRKDEMKGMRGRAIRVATGTGQTIRLVRFTRAEVMESIEPDASKPDPPLFREVSADLYADMNGSLRDMDGESHPFVQAVRERVRLIQEDDEEVPPNAKSATRMACGRSGDHVFIELGEGAQILIPPAAALLFAKIMKEGAETILQEKADASGG